MVDHNALAQAARTDEQAFTQLYYAYIDELYGFVMKRVGHRETTEDLVADIFRKVFLHLEKFDPKRAAFRTWLYRIATNTVIDYYRVHRAENRPSVVELDEARTVQSSDASPHDQVISSEQRELIRLCMEKLSARHQEVLRLKFFDDFSHQEIAAILDITPNYVGVTVHRAVKHITPCIEQIA